VTTDVYGFVHTNARQALGVLFLNQAGRIMLDGILIKALDWMPSQPEFLLDIHVS
jgi:hypothetical protein